MRAAPTIGAVVIATAVAACGHATPAASNSPSARPSTSPPASTPTTATAAPASSAAPQTTTPGVRPTTLVTGAGAYLKAPATPVTIPASDSCTRLVQRSTQSVTACATATTPKGTITAVLISEAHDTYVDIYRREGSSAVLVLTGLTEGGTDGTKIRLGTDDPGHDGDTKIAVVLGGAAGTDVGDADPPVDGYDLIDAPGIVTVHRTLDAGAVRATGDGIEDYTTDGPLRPVTASTLVYEQGAWHVTEQVAVQTVPARHDALVASAGS